MLIEYVIQNQFFSYTLEEFAQILNIPCEGACVFIDKWSLDELAYGVPRDGSYRTNPPSFDDIISYIQNDREGLVTRTRHRQNVDVQDYQILTREIVSTLKPLEEIIRAEGTLSFFVLLIDFGLLVLVVMSTPVEEKPFESELTTFLVMT
ncbi:hypothetical protein Tco_1578284 [Tanacetum coccineum]